MISGTMEKCSFFFFLWASKNQHQHLEQLFHTHRLTMPIKQNNNLKDKEYNNYYFIIDFVASFSW